MFSALFILGLTLVALVTLFLPWINQGRINKLHNEIIALRYKILRLEEKLNGLALKEKTTEQVEQKTTVESSYHSGLFKEESPQAPKEPTAPPLQHTVSPSSQAYKISTEKEAPRSEASFERKLAARLPVWIGGIALAFAGFYLVKYSIEKNLISPGIRVTAGIIAGFVLIFTADKISKAKDFANGIRISQSLTGAGIAVLYACIFAATTLYDFIPTYFGFFLMAGVTMLAVFLSLTHGLPVALLGLIGGFLTPTIVGNNLPSAQILFFYLAAIYAGLMLAYKQSKNWTLAIPTMLAAYLWAFYWIEVEYLPGDSLWLGLFVISILTVTFYCLQTFSSLEEEKSLPEWSKCLGYLSIIFAGLLFLLLGIKTEYGNFEWLLFACLAGASIALAFFNPRLYYASPYITLGVNLIQLFTWSNPNVGNFCIWILIFAALFAVPSYFLIWISKEKKLWLSIYSISSLAFYLIAYIKLYSQQNWQPLPYFWGIVALTLAAFSALNLLKAKGQDQLTEDVRSVFYFLLVSFLSIAATIELDKEFLSIFFAIEFFGLSYLSSRASFKELRKIAGIIFAIFIFLLLEQFLLLGKITLYSLTETQMFKGELAPIMKWPLFQLGLPAALFIAASKLFRKEEDDTFIYWIESVAVFLLIIMGYYLNRHLFHIPEEILFKKAGFFERGVTTNLILIFGLLGAVCGRLYLRDAYKHASVILLLVGLFRVLYFDLLIYNPLSQSVEIGQLLLFNPLSLTFCVPALWMYLYAAEYKKLDYPRMLTVASIALFGFVFLFINFSVRHYFHRVSLNSGATSNTEIYSYSLAWLTLGIAILSFGIIKKHKLARYASLALMILTAAKVFLYDASELEGLFRVFSFLGLGLCLIGLSYFYVRFVFQDER